MESKLLLSLALAAIATGCSSPRMKVMHIDSDPQGMRVEVSGSDVGKTPTSASAPVTGNGDFSGSWVQGPDIVIVATPPVGVTNLYPQQKVFHLNAFFQKGDMAPDNVFFDMHRKP